VDQDRPLQLRGKPSDRFKHEPLACRARSVEKPLDAALQT
jgi:hypothetical protein